MRDDLIDRLRRENPQAGPMRPISIETVMSRLDEEPPMGGQPRGRRAALIARVRVALPVGLSVIVALAVAAVILTSGGYKPAAPSDGQPAGQLVPLAVFSRPQTAIDRSLPGVLRRAARLGGLPRGFAADALRGTIASTTHYVATLPGGREVFVSSVRIAAMFPPRPGHRSPPAAANQLGVRLIVVQPDGKWTDGQPISAPILGSADNRSAYMEAVGGSAGCFGDTYIGVAPNNVSRIRWQFPRQDRQGYVYNAPLTVDIPVHGNVAATTVPQRATCDRPSVVALYGPRGGLLVQTGSAAGLDRITRPVRHGNPFAGHNRLEHRSRAR